MIKTDVKIINKLGLHARASSLFVKVANSFQSDIMVTLDNKSINGKSILGLMMLAATQNTVITIQVDGEDEVEASQALIDLINHYFEEGE